MFRRQGVCARSIWTPSGAPTVCAPNPQQLRYERDLHSRTPYSIQYNAAQPCDKGRRSPPHADSERRSEFSADVLAFLRDAAFADLANLVPSTPYTESKRTRRFHSSVESFHELVVAAVGLVGEVEYVQQ